MSHPVYVVSWVIWHGGEQTSGGFDWYPVEADARTGFDREKADWEAGDVRVAGMGARVRLVEVRVPAHLNGPDVTEWLDDRIDLIEDFRQTRAAGDRSLAVALVA